MSRTYKFHNVEGAYFVSSAVVVPIAIGRIDVFTRNEYKDILLATRKDYLR